METSTGGHNLTIAEGHDFTLGKYADIVIESGDALMLNQSAVFTVEEDTGYNHQGTLYINEGATLGFNCGRCFIVSLAFRFGFRQPGCGISDDVSLVLMTTEREQGHASKVYARYGEEHHVQRKRIGLVNRSRPQRCPIALACVASAIS